MWLHRLSVVSCFILAILSSGIAQDCPENEVATECANTCNTCRPQPFCGGVCTPGCDCSPGLVKNEFGLCIPREQCPVEDPSAGVSPPIGPEIVDEEETGGCPLIRLCRASCQRRGFRSGVCTGRGRRICRCIGPRGEDEEPPEVEDEESGGCPNLFRCVTSCRRRGFITGFCTGTGRRTCRCVGRSTDQKPIPDDESTPESGDGGEDGSDPSDEDSVSPPDERGEEDGGCPAQNLCARNCRRRGFRTGVCIGRRKRTCRCIGRQESKSEVEPVDESGGCPNVFRCITSCRRRGFFAGFCSGRRRKTCICVRGGSSESGGQGDSTDGSPDESDDSGGCPRIHLCVRSCNRRGFTGGTCVGPRRNFCLCFGRRGNEEEPPEDPEVDEDESGGCPARRRCIRSCRRRRFRTGVCVGRGRRTCICSERPDGGEEPPSEDGDSGGCPRIHLCVRSCNRRGFTGGTCVGPRRNFCLCFGRRGNEEEPPEVPEVDDESGGCPSRRRCSESCRRRGFRTGVCVGRGRRTCRCLGRPDGGEEPPSEDGDSGGCPRIHLCVRSCNRRGFTGGTCVGPRRNFCLCFGRRGNEEEPPEIPEVDDESGGCPARRRCSESCRRRGFRSGVCVGRRRRTCICLGRLDGREEPPSEDGDSGGCPRIHLCVRSCNRRGFTGGTCVGPRRNFCLCFGRRGNEEEPPEVPEVDEDDSGGCPVQRLCSRSCRRRGFRTGVCVGRRRRTCKCRGRDEGVDTDTETDPPSEGDETGGCPNVRKCTRSCINRGFDLGVCIGRRNRTCACRRRDPDPEE